MKVTFLAVTYAPSVGGAQTYVRRVAEGLAAGGHEVEVLTVDILRSPAGREPGRVGRSHEVIGGVAVRRFPLARRTHGAVRLADKVAQSVARRGTPPHPSRHGPYAGRLAIAALAASRTRDVIVGCSAPFTTVLGPRATAVGGAAAVAVPLLHPSQHEPARSVAWALRGCHGVAASTEHERAAQTAMGVDPDRIALLPPGCDPDLYPDVTPSEARRQAGLPERPTVGFLGRLAAYKGLDTLLDAAPAIWRAAPDTTVLVAGASVGWGGLERRLAALAADAGDRLVVRRDFTELERPTLLSACDVVATPSREEAFGMVNAEAWCAHRPVVAGDIPSVACLVRPSINGTLVPVGDPDRLAEAVLGLLGDPDRSTAMGRAGRAMVEAELRWDVIIEGWDELLCAAVCRRRTAASPRTRRGRPCAA